MSFQVYQAQGLRIYTGDTATVNQYVGLAGELAITTDNKSIRILDGINPGGTPLTTANGAELQGLNIEQLANLLVSAPQDGEALVYEGGKWKNKAVAASGSGGASHVNDLVDVKLTNLQTGEVLSYNASIMKWENKAIAAADHNHDSKYQLKGNYLRDTSNLGEVNDVQITMPADGQSLVYDAGYQKWINTTLAAVASGNTSSVNVPCFHAVLAGVASDTRNQTPLLFTDVRTNYTSSYDPSTGLFTAPEDGYYYFGAGAHRNITSGWATIRLHVAGEQISNAWGQDTGSSSGQLFCCGVKYMSAGDTAYVSMSTDKSSNYMAETYWYFTGFLINASGSGVNSTAYSQLDTDASRGATTNADNSELPIFACRAFCTFDGTDVTTVNGESHCRIIGSGNISKVVRYATGKYTIHFKTPMPDDAYSVSATGTAWGTSSGSISLEYREGDGGMWEDRFDIRAYQSSGTAINTHSKICIQVFR